MDVFERRKLNWGSLYLTHAISNATSDALVKNIPIKYIVLGNTENAILAKHKPTKPTNKLTITLRFACLLISITSCIMSTLSPKPKVNDTSEYCPNQQSSYPLASYTISMPPAQPRLSHRFHSPLTATL